MVAIGCGPVFVETCRQTGNNMFWSALGFSIAQCRCETQQPFVRSIEVLISLLEVSARIVREVNCAHHVVTSGPAPSMRACTEIVDATWAKHEPHGMISWYATTGSSRPEAMWLPL